MAYSIVNFGLPVQTYSSSAAFGTLSGGADPSLNAAAIPYVMGLHLATETAYELASDGADASGITAPTTVGGGAVGPRTWQSASYGQLSSINQALSTGAAQVTINDISGTRNTISISQTAQRPTTAQQAVTGGTALNVLFPNDITRLVLQNDSNDIWYYSTVAAEVASTASESLPPGVMVELSEKILQAYGISVYCAVSHTTNAANSLKIKAGHF